MADSDYDRMIRERYNALALRCDELTKEVERLKAEVAANQEAAEVRAKHAVLNAAKEAGITLPAKANQPDVFPHKFAEFVAEMSVHQQLAAAEKELASLRKDREAWDAVRKYYLALDRAWVNNQWQASAPNIDGVLFGPRHADPREAVLALKAMMEGGK